MIFLLQVLTECCAVLGEDTVETGLQLSLTDQLIQQAEQAPSLGVARRQVRDWTPAQSY
jgi:hypothetical protein